jgi:hypothetical protein
MNDKDVETNNNGLAEDINPAVIWIDSSSYNLPPSRESNGDP